MPLITATRNAMLNSLTITHASLHTGDPGTNGANEVTGGSYARQAVTMAAASNGTRSASNQPVFNVPAATTVAHIGLWNNSTFLGSADPVDETFSNAGTYTVTAITIGVS